MNWITMLGVLLRILRKRPKELRLYDRRRVSGIWIVKLSGERVGTSIWNGTKYQWETHKNGQLLRDLRHMRPIKYAGRSV